VPLYFWGSLGSKGNTQRLRKGDFEMVRRFAVSFALLLTAMMLVFSDWASWMETVTLSTIEQGVDVLLPKSE
jgi:hypothetical protein